MGWQKTQILFHIRWLCGFDRRSGLASERGQLESKNNVNDICQISFLNICELQNLSKKSILNVNM